MANFEGKRGSVSVRVGLILLIVILSVKILADVMDSGDFTLEEIDIPNDLISTNTFNSRTPTGRKRHYIKGHSARKLILFWTGTEVAKEKFGDVIKAFPSQCRNSRCELTSYRPRLNESDAVIVHARDVFKLGNATAKLDLPKRMDSDQIFVYWDLETAEDTRSISVPEVDGMFNLTISHVKHPCTDIYPTRGSVIRQRSILPDNKMSKIMKRKSRLAVVMHTTCDELQGSYMLKLRRYLNMEIIGKCGKSLNCSFINGNGMDHRCLSDTIEEYKFHIVLDSRTDCVDEAPFALYWALGHVVVPVVIGGGRYRDTLPPHSYVDSAGFPSAKDLAHYLLELSENQLLYMQYFEWKKTLTTDVNWGAMELCRLCEILNSRYYSYHPSCFRLADYVSSASTCSAGQGG